MYRIYYNILEYIMYVQNTITNNINYLFAICE